MMITADSLSSSFLSVGVTPNAELISEKTGSTIAQPEQYKSKNNFWDGLKNAAGSVWNWLVKPTPTRIQSPLTYLNQAVEGVYNWGKENKELAIAATSTAASVGALFALNQVGMNPADLMRNLLNFGEFAYNFNWDVSDKSLWEFIKQQINSLYGPAGELVGGSLARLIVMGTFTPPKIQVNIRALALQFECAENDIREELLQNISQFAYMGMTVARYITFAFTFIQGRQAIKQFFAKNGPQIPIKSDNGTTKYIQGEGDNPNRKLLKKTNPQLLSMIDRWGDEKEEDWRMSAWVDKKVESIPDERIRNFVEGFLEGFWEAFRESIEAVYE